MRAAVFFDRDGVINELVPDPVSGLPESPLSAKQVVLTPSAVDALRRLRGAGYLLVGTSNQPAAAKGTAALEELERVQARVLELLEQADAAPDVFRICFHHPAGVIADLAIACQCRKPSPGLLLDAARELDVDLRRSWMVGDTDADVAAGVAAGCRTILVEHPGSEHKRSSGVRPNATVPDFAAAAAFVIAAVTH